MSSPQREDIQSPDYTVVDALELHHFPFHGFQSLRTTVTLNPRDSEPRWNIVTAIPGLVGGFAGNVDNEDTFISICKMIQNFGENNGIVHHSQMSFLLAVYHPRGAYERDVTTLPVDLINQNHPPGKNHSPS
ncbi:hypothetical protein IL306_007715 [Fusarium sp. DS 682]|nr:hypothetical protein IL306_007715 [Fusarium sp. DS 682]